MQMSDLADRCGASVAEVENLGGTFRTPQQVACLGMRHLASCSCGGRPAFFPAGRAEVLRCRSCDNAVGPLFSRQALGRDWNDYGCHNGRTP